MQNIFLGASVGLALALVLKSLRMRHWPLALYWICITAPLLPMGDLWVGTLPTSAWILAVIAFQWYLLRFFRLSFTPKQLASVNLPILLLVLLAVFWQMTGQYAIMAAFGWGVLTLIAIIRRQYRLRGIAAFGRSGARILWINLAAGHLVVGFTISLLLPEGFFNPIFSTLWLLFSTWHFSKEVTFSGFEPAPKYSKSTLDAKEKARLASRLDALIDEGEYFLRPDSSLQGLSKELHTSTHNVSQLLNETKGRTFFEIQAQVRMRRAKSLLANKSYDHLKIEEIGNRVGYASKSSFNTTFKKQTGRTPSEYRAQHVRPYKVERPTDGVERDSLRLLDTFEWIQNSSVMFSNFFKVYFRTQLRNKLFSGINLVGLVTGLCSAIFILVYLQHELSYDTFHERSEDIYRIIWQSDNPQTRTPHPAAQALVRDFPEVESAVSFSPVYGPGLTLQSIYVRNPLNNRMFREPDCFSADSTFFDVFDFELLVGDPNTALDDVGDVVISETLARKYFDDESPLGKIIEFVEYGFSGMVSGVMEDAPAGSHFHPQVLISYVSRKSAQPDLEWWTWADFGHFNYIKLRPGTDASSLESAMIEWVTGYVDLSEDDLASLRARHHYLELQPITDIHLHSDVRWELEANGSITFVRILAASLLFLVVIVAINFVNLSTARAFERSKEVGIRRSLGAHKMTVSLQFLLESVITTLLALVVAFFCALLLFNQFVHLAGLPVDTSVLLHPTILLSSVAVALLIGIITGIYPSLAVVNIEPVEILKGKSNPRARAGGMRKALILVQFMVSTIMIFGSTVILQQVRYIEDKDLGFETDELMVMELHDRSEMQRLPAMKAEVMKIPGVLGAAGISNLPGTQFNQNPVFAVNNPDHVVSFAEVKLDFGTLELMGLELEGGRWLDQSMGVDSSGVSFVVNEAAVAQLQLERPFDTPIRWVTEGPGFEGKIVGVIEDFHYKSLHKAIQPLIMQINAQDMNYLLIKVAAGANVSEVVQGLSQVHASFDQQFDMDYYFLDRVIDDQYQAEQRALAIFRIFTFLAIIMAALGLLGMAFLVITQRTKEIGIRKVIGATSTDIWWMELRPFLVIIGLSLALGLPLSHYAMDQWLNIFAYRTSLDWVPYAGSTLILLVVAILTVSVAVLRTILRNPSKSLRYE